MKAIIELSLLESCPSLTKLVDVKNPAETLDIDKIIKLDTNYHSIYKVIRFER